MILLIIIQEFFINVLSYNQLLSQNQINISVWAEVIRRSTINIAQVHIDRKDPYIPLGLILHGGWYMIIYIHY